MAIGQDDSMPFSPLPACPNQAVDQRRHDHARPEFDWRDQLCQQAENNTAMLNQTGYTIAKGTVVHIRNEATELRLRRHVTRTDLTFDDYVVTGDGGTLYYFQHGDWLISVDAEHVQPGRQSNCLSETTGPMRQTA
jgi:hypothetical protein